MRNNRRDGTASRMDQEFERERQPLPPLTRQAEKVIECAAEQARLQNRELVGTLQLLLSMLHESESTAALTLMDLGLSPNELGREIARRHGGAADPELSMRAGGRLKASGPRGRTGARSRG